LKIILASTSPYRVALLEKLRLPFIQVDPGYLEERVPGEAPGELCRRLAEAKARSVPRPETAAPWLVIASDQVASLPGGELLGKPGGFDAAVSQLQRCSGRRVAFETAICLLTSDGECRVDVDVFEVRFRELDEHTIRRYLELDAPFDCAGSSRAESLGIALIADSRGRDFNTLLGLPLMLLTDMLAGLGIDIIKEIK